MFSPELICHQVIPKSSRMNQEWPELGGLYCGPLCQATAKRLKSSFLLGDWGADWAPCVRPCLCSVCVNPVVGAGKSVGQLHTASLTLPGHLLMAFTSENWNVGSLGAVLPCWCCFNTLVQESRAWRGALCSLTFGRITWEVLQWLGSERIEILLHPPAQAVTFLIRYMWTSSCILPFRALFSTSKACWGCGWQEGACVGTNKAVSSGAQWKCHPAVWCWQLQLVPFWIPEVPYGSNLTALPRWHEPLFPFRTAQCNHCFCSCAATDSLVSTDSNGRNIKVNLKWNAPQVVRGKWRHYFVATLLLPELQHPRCQEAMLSSLSGLDWLDCFHPSLFKAFLVPPYF